MGEFAVKLDRGERLERLRGKNPVAGVAGLPAAAPELLANFFAADGEPPLFSLRLERVFGLGRLQLLRVGRAAGDRLFGLPLLFEHRLRILEV